MNKPDCGNHRTGHPRWAQLMANTWNSFSEIRRTQQATRSVSPSHVRLTGFVNFARRVSPTGNVATDPSDTQDSYASSDLTGERRYLTTGTATATPTTALKRAPTFSRNHRLDTVSGSIGVCSSSCCPTGSFSSLTKSPLNTCLGIWLPRSIASQRMEIRDDVADVLIPQRLAMPDLFPIRVTKIRTPRDDDGPQALIAYERQIAGVGNLSWALLMTGSATDSDDLLSMFGIAYRVRRI